MSHGLHYTHTYIFTYIHTYLARSSRAWLKIAHFTLLFGFIGWHCIKLYCHHQRRYRQHISCQLVIVFFSSLTFTLYCLYFYIITQTGCPHIVWLTEMIGLVIEGAARRCYLYAKRIIRGHINTYCTKFIYEVLVSLRLHDRQW